jgi:hypothetical protein
MPERIGIVEFEAIPLETTTKAISSAVWLTVNFNVPPLSIVLFYIHTTIQVMSVEMTKDQEIGSSAMT